MPGKEADTPRTGKWGGGFRKGACGGVAGVRRNLPRREPRPGGVPSKPPSRASGISVPAPQMLRPSSHAVPDGGGVFPFGRLFPTAHRICNLQSARMVMDSNQKTIKGAQSVYRVLNILEEVILCGDRMITPKELSASLDIPVATVHRLLTVLRQKNFVACDPATKKYHIGDSCLISPRMDVAAFIRARFLPLAERISRRFGYSTILYARSGYDAVCVERLDGWHPIQVFLNKTGDRRPLGMGSATLSILAAMPEDEAEMILTHNEQEIRFVLKTDFSALRGFLAEARRKGYASAQGMLLEGTIGVSHVLRMGNEAVGSIAIDAVRSEQWDKDQPKIIQELQSALS